MMTIVLAMLSAAATPSAYRHLPADLAAAAHAYDEAQVKGDRAALTRLLADDYILANSAGQHETKAQFIADLTTPGDTMEPFTIEQPVERVWHDGAVLGGTVQARDVSGGKRYDVRLRFADIWAKRGGRWQVIYSQADRRP